MKILSRSPITLCQKTEIANGLLLTNILRKALGFYLKSEDLVGCSTPHAHAKYFFWAC